MLTMILSEILFICVSFLNGCAQFMFLQKQGLKQSSHAGDSFREYSQRRGVGPGKSKAVRRKSLHLVGIPWGTVWNAP